MAFIRKIANSDILAGIIDIPEYLKNKKVEILVLPYNDENTENNTVEPKPKRARGSLEKYKDNKLQSLENNAWAKAVEDKHEHS